MFRTLCAVVAQMPICDQCDFLATTCTILVVTAVVWRADVFPGTASGVQVNVTGLVESTDCQHSSVRSSLAEFLTVGPSTLMTFAPMNNQQILGPWEMLHHPDQ